MRFRYCHVTFPRQLGVLQMMFTFIRQVVDYLNNLICILSIIDTLFRDLIVELNLKLYSGWLVVIFCLNNLTEASIFLINHCHFDINAILLHYSIFESLSARQESLKLVIWHEPISFGTLWHITFDASLVSTDSHRWINVRRKAWISWYRILTFWFNFVWTWYRLRNKT